MALIHRDILTEIYNKIYSKKKDFSINVFLCGANSQRSDSLRNLINDEIKDNPKFNVVFPEWLFSDLLVDKKFNLFKLEKMLASNVDVIVLPLEGYGTMAELGAFASSRKLNSKIIVINHKKYKRDRSFITLGPVKLIASQNKENVIYYDEQTLSELKKTVLNRIKHLRSSESKTDIKNLFNLSRFILYIIAIFQPIQKEEVRKYLDEFLDKTPSHFIGPCVQILFEKRQIKLEPAYRECYVLSESGHKYVYEELLHELNVIKKFSQIRAKIINTKIRKQNRLSLDKERERFLAI